MSEAIEGNQEASVNTIISIRVTGMDGSCCVFRMNKHNKLKKLMSTYCRNRKLDFQVMRFRFDGERVNGEQTPEELEMEDEDSIDVFSHQVGGRFVGIKDDINHVTLTQLY